MQSYVALSDQHVGEVAVVGMHDQRDMYGRVVPCGIKQLLRDAENECPDRALSWIDGYECVCVLSEAVERFQDSSASPR